MVRAPGRSSRSSPGTSPGPRGRRGRPAPRVALHRSPRPSRSPGPPGVPPPSERSRVLSGRVFRQLSRLPGFQRPQRPHVRPRRYDRLGRTARARHPGAAPDQRLARPALGHRARRPCLDAGRGRVERVEEGILQRQGRHAACERQAGAQHGDGPPEGVHVPSRPSLPASHVPGPSAGIPVRITGRSLPDRGGGCPGPSPGGESRLRRRGRLRHGIRGPCVPAGAGPRPRPPWPDRPAAPSPR